MNITLRRTLALGSAIAAAAALTACTINIGTGNDPYGDHMNDGGMMHQSDSAMGTMDLMFAQMMIPHHEQAIVMSDLILETTTNPDIRALAEQIKGAQAPEIEQMKGWLDDANTSHQMDHDMGMDGMLSASEMAELEAATGVERDRLFLEGMIAHHEGAIQMADMIIDSQNAEARALADAIVTGQTAEIATMTALLSALG